MPRNDITLASKIALLDKIKNQPVGTSHRKLAEITGVSKSTISRLLQQENQLRMEWALDKERNGKTKRKRDGKDPEVEQVLLQWFSIVSKRGTNISGPMLKAKSEEIAEKLGHNGFTATDGWLSRWKARHNIKLKKGNSGKDNVDNLVPEQWDNTEITTLLGNEEPEEVIVEVIKSEHQQYDEEDIDDDVANRLVTHQEAAQYIAGLQRYFMQEGNEGSPKLALKICADFVKAQNFQSQTTDYT